MVVAACSAFEFCGLSVPKFEILANVVYQVAIPSTISHEGFIEALCASTSLVNQNTSIVSSNLARDFSQQKLIALASATVKTEQVLTDVLRNEGVENVFVRKQLGYGELFLLRILATFQQIPHVFVYHTTGCDPSMAKKIDRIVAVQLSRSVLAAIKIMPVSGGTSVLVSKYGQEDSYIQGGAEMLAQQFIEQIKGVVVSKFNRNN